MTALTATAKIVIPVSLSMAALTSSKIFAEDYINAISDAQVCRVAVLPQGIAEAIAAEVFAARFRHGLSLTALSYGSGFPPDVEEIIAQNGLQDAIRSTISVVKAKYDKILEIGFETLADPDSDEKWIIVGISTELNPESMSMAYDNFVSDWVDTIEDEKRHLIRIEHIYI